VRAYPYREAINRPSRPPHGADRSAGRSGGGALLGNIGGLYRSRSPPLTYQLSGLPGGLSINETTRVIWGTPTEAGTFVLAYSATDPGPLTNSVSFALTVNPASTTSLTGSFEGYLDKVECTSLRGWVWDRGKPNTPLTVEFYTDGTVWGSVVANIYRDDLKAAGKGNGVHAYNFTVPEASSRAVT
jgi:hypothetical protein